VERTSKQLLKLTGDSETRDRMDQELIARLLIRAFPDRICKQRETGSNRFVHAQGRGVRLSLNSRLLGSAFIVAATVDAGEQAEGYIHVAASAPEALIRAECASRICRVRKVEWDRNEGRVIAVVEERLETLVLSSRFFSPNDEEAAPLVFDAIRADPAMLAFTHEARQFQARVKLVAGAFPGENWPDLSEARLFADPGAWLLPWIEGVRGIHDIKGIKILPALKNMLTWEQGRLLDERAPAGITVPSGSRVALDYTTGEQPVLAVKLQEMFGLADTPVIAAGRVKVLLHLLSPARRPVQITQDLKGFWNNAYQDVKKDLKGRYPKHPWPDDPWNAAPTRRTKPRGT
jgi:ATP-dependent RNA helicase HrpB